jgi:hypothetical protein
VQDRAYLGLAPARAAEAQGIYAVNGREDKVAGWGWAMRRCGAHAGGTFSSAAGLGVYRPSPTPSTSTSVELKSVPLNKSGSASATASA